MGGVRFVASHLTHEKEQAMNSENTNQKPYSRTCCGASTGRWTAFWGILLVILGGLGLLSNFFPLQHLGGYILPAFLLLWGAFILFNLRQS